MRYRYKVSVDGTLKLENRNWEFGLPIITTEFHGNFTDVKNKIQCLSVKLRGNFF